MSTGDCINYYNGDTCSNCWIYIAILFSYVLMDLYFKNQRAMQDAAQRAEESRQYMELIRQLYGYEGECEEQDAEDEDEYEEQGEDGEDEYEEQGEDGDEEIELEDDDYDDHEE